MTTLVTGATGNVGTATRKRLTPRPHSLSHLRFGSGGVLLTRVNRWLG